MKKTVILLGIMICSSIYAKKNPSSELPCQWNDSIGIVSVVGIGKGMSPDRAIMAAMIVAQTMLRQKARVSVLQDYEIICQKVEQTSPRSYTAYIALQMQLAENDAVNDAVKTEVKHNSELDNDIQFYHNLLRAGEIED